jgi:uncharacterized protein YrrD
MKFPNPFSRTVITGMFLLVMLGVCSIADASILGGIKDWMFDNALNVILAGIFTLIAGFFGGTTWGKAILKAKLPLTELKDVAVRIHEARRPSSPGGKSITTEEKDAILKEAEDLIQSVVTTFGKGE